MIGVFAWIYSTRFWEYQFLRMISNNLSDLVSMILRVLPVESQDQYLSNSVIVLSKLKNADESYKRIIFTNDMIKEDQNDYKK